MPLQDTDILLVNRNGASFRETFANLKDALPDEKWDRTGTTLSPTNAGDTIATDDNSVQLVPGTTGSPLVRDANGRLLVGTSADGTGRRLQVEGTDFASSCLSTRRESDNDGGSAIELYKSRGSSFELVSDDDELGYIRFYGSQGTADAEAARIRVDVDGTPSATSMPGRLLFFTTPSDSTAPVERMRISADGSTSMTGRVSITQRTITSAAAWDSATANYWTFAGGTIANPTNQVAGTCGLIVCTGAVTGWGTAFNSVDVSTVPAVVPYYIQASGTIRVGQPVEVG